MRLVDEGDPERAPLTPAPGMRRLGAHVPERVQPQHLVLGRAVGTVAPRRAAHQQPGARSPMPLATASAHGAAGLEVGEQPAEEGGERASVAAVAAVEAKLTEQASEMRQVQASPCQIHAVYVCEVPHRVTNVAPRPPCCAVLCCAVEISCGWS